MEEIRKTIFDNYEVSNLWRFRKVYTKSKKIKCWIEDYRYYSIRDWKQVRQRCKRYKYLRIKCIKHNYLRWSVIKKNNEWKNYISIMVYNKWDSKRYLIHRIVAKAFLWLDIDNQNIHVCHKDDNPENNYLSNLMLWDAKSNILDASMKNRMKSKLWIDDIKRAREMFEMNCSDRYIAKRLQVSSTTIQKLRHNKHRWILVI